jgi:biotin carboxylase
MEIPGMNRIAIIGANESINHAILKAKDMGYETHVFAWQNGDVGEKTADFFYPISVADKENVLEVCKKIKPVAIVSITSDFAVRTVNYVARNLGLTCNSEKTDIYARDKYKMRSAFKEAGIPTPWFIEVDKYFSLDDVRDVEYPLIVKPIDSWSSKGVTRVDSQERLLNAINRAIEESYEGKAIIEGFMEGPEYSCECISYAGKHHFLTFTKKYTTGSPNYIEIGHVQPTDISAEDQKKVISVIFRALDALDIQYGASHTEFRILNNGEVGIIEIGARMGGGCIGTDLVQISTGYDYVKMTIDVALGKEPSFQKVSNPKTAVVKFIMEEKDLEIMEQIKATSPPSIWRISAIEDIGTRIVTDNSKRFGYYVLAIDSNDKKFDTIYLEKIGLR